MRSLYLANKGELELEKQRVSELLLQISTMKDKTEELQIAKAEIDRMKVVHKEELKRENRRYGGLVAQERRRYDRLIAKLTGLCGLLAKDKKRTDEFLAHDKRQRNERLARKEEQAGITREAVRRCQEGEKQKAVYHCH